MAKTQALFNKKTFAFVLVMTVHHRWIVGERSPGQSGRGKGRQLRARGHGRFDMFG